MADYGLAVLSGLLGGAGGGLARGMQAADEMALQREHLAEQRRQFDEARLTDLGQLSSLLGVQLPGGMPTGPVPTNTANLVVGKLLQDQTRRTEQARMDALRATLPERVRPFFGTQGGAELYKAAYPEDVQKPSAPHYVEDAEGNVTAITVQGGQPTAMPVPGVRGKGKETSAKTSAERLAAARAAYAANATPQTKAVLDQAEDANRIELQRAATLAGATTGARITAQGQEFLSPTEAADLGVPYGTRKGEAGGKTALTSTQRTKMDAQNAVLAIIDNLEKDLKDVGAPNSVTGRVLATPGAMANVYGQADPKLAALHGRLQGTLSLIVRALGEVGTLNEGDIKRAQSLMPVIAPVPDRADVIAEKLTKLRALVKEIAARTGSRPDSTGAPASQPETPQYVEGKLYRGSDGKPYRFQNGRMVPQ